MGTAKSVGIPQNERGVFDHLGNQGKNPIRGGRMSSFVYLHTLKYCFPKKHIIPQSYFYLAFRSDKKADNMITLIYLPALSCDLKLSSEL